MKQTRRSLYQTRWVRSITSVPTVVAHYAWGATVLMTQLIRTGLRDRNRPF